MVKVQTTPRTTGERKGSMSQINGLWTRVRYPCGVQLLWHTCLYTFEFYKMRTVKKPFALLRCVVGYLAD